MKSSLFTTMLSGRTLRDAIQIAAEIGYESVEIMSKEPHLSLEEWGDEDVAAIAELIAAADMTVSCLYTTTGSYVGKGADECQEELDRLRQYLEFAEILECDLLRHQAGGPPVVDARDTDYEEAADGLRAAGELAAEYGKKIAVELHPYGLTETAESTMRLLDEVGRENVGAIHDPGNVYIVGAEYGHGAVETLGDSLFHVHLKDMASVDDEALPGTYRYDGGELEPRLFQHRQLGEGDVDYAAVLRALRRVGYEGYLSCECHVPQETSDADTKITAHEYRQLTALLSSPQ